MHIHHALLTLIALSALAGCHREPCTLDTSRIVEPTGDAKTTCPEGYSLSGFRGTDPEYQGLRCFRGKEPSELLRGDCSCDTEESAPPTLVCR